MHSNPLIGSANRFRFSAPANSNINVDRDALRKRDRQARALLLEEMQEPPANPIFPQPIRVEPGLEDETSRRIRSTLGDFTQVQPYLISDPKHLIGISSVTSRPPPPPQPPAPPPEKHQRAVAAAMAILANNNKKPQIAPLNGLRKTHNGNHNHIKTESSKSSSQPTIKSKSHMKRSSSSSSSKSEVKPPLLNGSLSSTSGVQQQQGEHRSKGALKGGLLHPPPRRPPTPSPPPPPPQQNTPQKLSRIPLPEKEEHEEEEADCAVESILQEMKLGVPAPLTAIETPRLEETTFHFSPRRTSLQLQHHQPEPIINSGDHKKRQHHSVPATSAAPLVDVKMPNLKRRQSKQSPYSLQADLEVTDSEEEHDITALGAANGTERLHPLQPIGSPPVSSPYVPSESLVEAIPSTPESVRADKKQVEEKTTEVTISKSPTAAADGGGAKGSSSFSSSDSGSSSEDDSSSEEEEDGKPSAASSPDPNAKVATQGWGLINFLPNPGSGSPGLPKPGGGGPPRGPDSSLVEEETVSLFLSKYPSHLNFSPRSDVMLLEPPSVDSEQEGDAKPFSNRGNSMGRTAGYKGSRPPSPTVSPPPSPQQRLLLSSSSSSPTVNSTMLPTVPLSPPKRTPPRDKRVKKKPGKALVTKATTRPAPKEQQKSMALKIKSKEYVKTSSSSSESSSDEEVDVVNTPVKKVLQLPVKKPSKSERKRTPALVPPKSSSSVSSKKDRKETNKQRPSLSLLSNCDGTEPKVNVSLLQPKVGMTPDEKECKENVVPRVLVSIQLSCLDRVPPYPPQNQAPLRPEDSVIRQRTKRPISPPCSPPIVQRIKKENMRDLRPLSPPCDPPIVQRHKKEVIRDLWPLSPPCDPPIVQRHKKEGIRDLALVLDRCVLGKTVTDDSSVTVLNDGAQATSKDSEDDVVKKKKRKKRKAMEECEDKELLKKKPKTEKESDRKHGASPRLSRSDRSPCGSVTSNTSTHHSRNSQPNLSSKKESSSKGERSKERRPNEPASSVLQAEALSKDSHSKDDRTKEEPPNKCKEERNKSETRSKEEQRIKEEPLLKCKVERKEEAPPRVKEEHRIKEEPRVKEDSRRADSRNRGDREDSRNRGDREDSRNRGDREDSRNREESRIQEEPRIKEEFRNREEHRSRVEHRCREAKEESVRVKEERNKDDQAKSREDRTKEDYVRIKEERVEKERIKEDQSRCKEDRSSSRDSRSKGDRGKVEEEKKEERSRERSKPEKSQVDEMTDSSKSGRNSSCKEEKKSSKRREEKGSKHKNRVKDPPQVQPQLQSISTQPERKRTKTKDSTCEPPGSDLGNKASTSHELSGFSQAPEMSSEAPHHSDLQNGAHPSTPTDCTINNNNNSSVHHIWEGSSSSRSRSEGESTNKASIAENDTRQHSSDYYMVEAKRLKHQADKETDRTVQAMKYLEAVLYFIMTGNTMEHARGDTEKVYTMYKETLNLIKYISSKFQKIQHSSAGSTDNKLAILSLRCQSLLHLKLYYLRKPEVKDLQRDLSDFHKSPAGKMVSSQKSPASSQLQHPGSQSLSSSSQQAPSSRCRLQQPSPHGKCIPSSPHSPTPSPAGSVASVGSQSSGYSSSELTGCATGRHSCSNGVISIPQNVYGMMQRHSSHLGNLQTCHDLWEQADYLMHRSHSKEFFCQLDSECTRLTLHSSVAELLQYVRKGLYLLKGSA